MSYQPLVSVYMPTHNRGARLHRAVESVIGQNYKNWELIVVNDGSSDGTYDYLNGLAKKYNNVKVLHNDIPRGACHARNRAIEQAKGEFITGLDDDDEFEVNRLEYFVENWNSEFDALCTPVTVCRGEKRQQHNFFIGPIYLADMLVINKIGNQIFCKTADMRAVGGFDETFKARQDYDTWIRFLSQFRGCLKLPRATYIQHEDSATTSITRSENCLIGFNQFEQKHQHLLNQRQINALQCWKHIVQKKFIPLSLLLRADKDIYKYAIIHNIKKLTGLR